MAAYSATLRGASKVIVVDRHPDRLRLAESIGALAIDDSREDPVEQVLSMTNGQGADKVANVSATRRTIRKVTKNRTRP